MPAPLILAIQPDRRQASQLASIAKKVSAELVVAESAVRAVAIIGERLPDLILTPALLSQKDESAITDRLRESGADAAHIQTLTIPIFEISESPAKKGVLSSLRKGKRKGKGDAEESIVSATDRFAEEVSVYLTRAVEARRPRRKRKVESAPAPEPDPAPAAAAVSGAATEAVGAAPAEVAVGAAQPEVVAIAVSPEPEPQPETQPAPAPPTEAAAAHQDEPPVEDGLPSIEELSARTPSVPEPDRSLETGAEAIAAIQSEAAAVADVSDVPMPSGMPCVAELAMELSAIEAAPAGDAAPALPEPGGALDVNMDAVAAVMPAGSAPDDSLATVPIVPQHVAELQVDLPLNEAPPIGVAAPAPGEPTDSLRVSADVMAAMVPDVAAASELLVAPMPSMPATVAELPVELSHTEGLDSADKVVRAVPVPPAYAVETTIDAVVAVAAAAGHAAAGPAVPTPAMISRIAELQVEFPHTETFAAAQVPVIPAPARLVDMTAAAMAAMAPLVSGIGQHRPSPAPTVIAPLRELPVELPSSETAIFAQGAVVMPAPPSRAVDAGIDALAGMMPALAAADGRALSVPLVTPRVAELQIQLPAAAAFAPAHASAPAAPSLPPKSVEMSMAAIAAMVPFVNAAILGRVAPPPAAATSIPELPALLVPPPGAETGTGPNEALEPPAPPPTRYLSKAERKRERLQARKAARKQESRPDAPLTDESLFDPDQIRFSALIAKLDEVVAEGDHPPERSSDRSGPGTGGRKGRTSKPA